MRQTTVNCLAFNPRQGGGLYFWFELPDAKHFHDFCATLIQKATAAFECQLSPAAGLAGELRELQKLHEMNVLSQEEFEKAKAKLLEPVSHERIGFR